MTTLNIALSKEQIQIIARNPLDESLKDIRVKLRDCADAPTDGLLSMLILSPAAFNLLAPDGSGNVAGKLLEIKQTLRDGSLEPEELRPLLDVVNSSDANIWAAVIQLIQDTSSNRLDDSETRVIVEGELFHEIKGCTFRSVKGFWDKFLNPQRWREDQNTMLRGVMSAHDGKKWTGFPSTPDERLVWDWFRSLEERFLVGEQKTYDTGRFKATLLQLTRHVRGVFIDQPTRRFVQAFSLCGCTMELWEPGKFARALVGYATMSDDEMGLDTFIERDNADRHVTLDGTGGKETKIQLVKAMVRQQAIDGYVAKFSWVSDKRKLEVEHLTLAEERGVEGVAKLVAHRQITTIADLRDGLVFPNAHRFRDDGVAGSKILGSKRKSLSDTAASSKTSSHKRKSSSDYTSNASGPKRRRSGSKSRQVQELDDQLSIGKNKPSLYMESEEPWENRIYSCLVISPAGRVISDIRNIKELLEAMRDAIKAHRSLYIAGNILHRDISSNNIIITESKTKNDFKGMLIDLDLAKVRDSGPSGARHQTGTIQFMGVEVLRKADHTYRHGLGSFFYVLLWMCARQSSLLRRWIISSFKYIVATKEIMTEFPEALDAVEPLCLRIWKLLFPLDKDERMTFGTPVGEPDQLYRSIIAAYDEAISKL
ncbi:hypothetical protein B0T26DRAFT_814228 [Lasiosphaeria miniovina]|uniref:non-specific serine/threonine protein kinase n=1 Tax=Lasiosphaeria miniovina TaxID=1954250 RepID=A0AA40DNF1_9PEZI|nr:uncharacterized protein B0T26DRAFT_814228 [Lasiosphaeria miniovina]KAK0709610.1 hypothetical protein B0T26DRAFT_814228 [Lasiosphaeria miniovina]